jgi:hypothetical protein
VRRFLKPDPEPRVQVHATLPPHMVDYLKLWNPGNASGQIEELIERCMRMWPGGPSTNPRMRAETLELHRQAALACRMEED